MRDRITHFARWRSFRRIVFITGIGLGTLSATAYAERRAPNTARPGAVNPAASARAARPAPDITPAEVATLLSRNYEDRISQALSVYIPAKEFEASVIVTPSGVPLPRAPYEPKAVTSAALANRTPVELAPYIRQVKVQIALTARLMSSRRRIEELVSKALGLDSRRSDSVSFSNLGIDVEDDGWRKEKMDLRQEMALLKQENDKLNRDLSAAEQELRSREQALKDKEQQLKEEKQSSGPAIPDDVRHLVMGLMGGLFIVLLAAAIFFARSVSNTGRNVGGGLSSIAAAFENIGGSLTGGRQAGDETGGGIQNLEAKLISEGKNGGNTIASLPIDTINSHLLKFRTELLENMSEGTESVILRYLTQLCRHPDLVGRAVVALELLGRDMATSLFRRMGLPTQEAILQFLREGIHHRPKVEIMLEVSEELKTKMLVESFDKVRGAPSEKVGGRLVQLTDEDLAELVTTLDPDLLPRLFLYLTPDKIAYLLASLRRGDTGQFEKAVAALPRLPDAEKGEQQDDDILRNLDAILDKNKSDSQRPFLKVYQEIVERSDDEVGETIIRELSSDPRLSTYLRENIVNIHTFFRLTEDARAEIVETLSNREVAALATGVDESERGLLFDGLPARRNALVLEEYDTYVSRGGNAADAVFKKVKESIVKRLRDMKSQGTLAQVLSPSSTTALQSARGGASDENSGGNFDEGEAA